MKVRYNYLPQQFANPDEIFAEIRELLKTGDFTLGKQVTEFEQKFASLIGSRYAVGVASGTDAIKLSLRAAGIGPGDEVITAANTFIATVGAIAEIGAIPKFVDCNENYVLDVSKLEDHITENTKAIVPVHFTGEAVDMDEVIYQAAKYNLVVVEDACQSILAKFNGQNCGTFGDAGAFSLHPLKNLNVWSDGGMIVTDDENLYERLRLLRNHGLKDRDTIACMGYNSRLDTIQAIVGNWLIPQAEEITKKRRENAAYYNKFLSGYVLLPPERNNAESCYHLYMFQVDESIRDKLLKHLQDQGIDAKVHYPIPLYQQEGLKKYGYLAGDFPVTDRQAARLISLPVDQHVTKEQLDYVIEKVIEFFA